MKTSPVPVELRHLDGHPMFNLASRVWVDLVAVGIPISLTPEGPPAAAPPGMWLTISTKRISLNWAHPDETRVKTSNNPLLTQVAAEQGMARRSGPASPYGEDELAAVSYAATALTNAVAGILVALGYRVRGELAEEPYGPYLHLGPEDGPLTC